MIACQILLQEELKVLLQEELKVTLIDKKIVHFDLTWKIGPSNIVYRNTHTHSFADIYMQLFIFLTERI